MPTGLEQLYSSHHSMVFATAYRVTGNAADAEDVLHTVFVRLLKRDDGQEITNPEGYLRRSAVNAALDIVRARREAPGVELDRMPAYGVDPELGDLQKHLRRAIAALPARTAEVFTLRHIEGHKNPEIAKMLGISQVVVGVTLHRARKKLQDELKKLGVVR